MGGLSEALDAPRNCEPNGTHVSIFWEKDPELSEFQKGALCKKRVKGSSAQAFGLYAFKIT